MPQETPNAALLALRAGEERYRLGWIVEHSDDAILSCDLDGIITSWNRAAERLFGYESREAIGKPIGFLIPSDRIEGELSRFERIGRGDCAERYDTVRQRKDGGLIEVALSISHIRNPQDEIIGTGQIVRDITERKLSEEQIAALGREAEHRVRNLLAAVQTAVHLSHAETPEGVKAMIEGRIQALANVHTLFVESRWNGAELSKIVTRELAPYTLNDVSRARINGPELMLVPHIAQAIAVILHELATNAAKYGAFSVANGHVEIEWSRAPDGRLALRWTERGGPPAEPPARQGFGTRVIEQLAKRQLRGEARFDWQAHGLACEISIPIQ
jgi:PAS domain S-box-containing protein